MKVLKFFPFFEKSIEANLPFKMHCLGLGAMMTPVFLWDCLTRVGSFLNLPEIRLTVYTSDFRHVFLPKKNPYDMDPFF